MNNINRVEDIASQLSTIYDDVAELQLQVAELQTALATATADSGWLDLTLESGWTETQYSTEKPQYRKIGKVVMLRGCINATASAGELIATLPEGYRPDAGLFNHWCSALLSGQVDVQVKSSGLIRDYNKGNNARSFLSLSGISFITQ